MVNNLTVVPPALDQHPIRQESVELYRGFVRSLPLIGVGLVLLIASLLLAGVISRLLTYPLRHITDSELLRNVARKLAAVLIVVGGVVLFLRVSGLTAVALTVVSGTGLFGLVIGFAFRDIAGTSSLPSSCPSARPSTSATSRGRGLHRRRQPCLGPRHRPRRLRRQPHPDRQRHRLQVHHQEPHRQPQDAADLHPRHRVRRECHPRPGHRRGHPPRPRRRPRRARAAGAGRLARGVDHQPEGLLLDQRPRHERPQGQVRPHAPGPARPRERGHLDARRTPARSSSPRACPSSGRAATSWPRPGRLRATSAARKASAQTMADDQRPAATSAEGNLTSEVNAIREQAREARDPRAAPTSSAPTAGDEREQRTENREQQI